MLRGPGARGLCPSPPPHWDFSVGKGAGRLRDRPPSGYPTSLGQLFAVNPASVSSAHSRPPSWGPERKRGILPPNKLHKLTHEVFRPCASVSPSRP